MYMYMYMYVYKYGTVMLDFVLICTGMQVATDLHTQSTVSGRHMTPVTYMLDMSLQH